MKRILTLAVTFAMLTSAAFAEGVGVVDREKIQGSYSRMRTLEDEAALKMLELQRMQTEANIKQRQVKTDQPNNPVAFEQSQKAENEKLQAKQQEIVGWRDLQVKTLLTNINTAIDAVAKGKNLSAVVQKDTVIWGGTDITNDVLGRLNTK